MENHDLTNELQKLCENYWVSIELVNELIQSEKWNLWNKWTSHKTMIEALIRKNIN
jgi:hypothetical protein